LGGDDDPQGVHHQEEEAAMTISRAQIPAQVSKPPMKKKMAAGKPKDLSKAAKKMLKEIKRG